MTNINYWQNLKDALDTQKLRIILNRLNFWERNCSVDDINMFLYSRDHEWILNVTFKEEGTDIWADLEEALHVNVLKFTMRDFKLLCDYIQEEDPENSILF
jgi:hypothetical protein